MRLAAEDGDDMQAMTARRREDEMHTAALPRWIPELNAHLPLATSSVTDYLK